MKINFTSPLCVTGYGLTGLNIYLELIKRHEVSLFPIGGLEVPPGAVDPVNAGRNRAQFYDPNAPSVKVWHQNEQAEHVGRGRRVAFPFFEIDPLKPGEVHHLNAVDAVCVASHWAKRVAERSGVESSKLRVVPLGVDRSVFHENVVSERLDPDQTVFFSAGKFSKNKGHDFLLSAFNKAFEPADKVVLRVLGDIPVPGLERLNASWRSKFLTSKMGAAGRIQLSPRQPSQADVASWMAAGDVGVFVSRAEGWNLELLEAMSTSKPVIATDCTAHGEYAHGGNALLVNVPEAEVADDGVWFRGEGEWGRLGEPQEEQLVEHLRYCHRLKQTGSLPVNEGGLKTAAFYPWSNSAAKLAEAAFG